MGRVREVLFRLSAVALLLFMAVIPFSLFAVMAPWFLRGNVVEGVTPEIHRWHSAQFGSFAVLIGGALLALLLRPRSTAGLLQFLVAIEVFDVLLTALLPTRDNFQPPFFFGTLISLAILLATYPDRRALFRLRSDEPASPIAIALTAIVALPLLYDVFRNLSWQFAGVADEHLYWGHWTNAVIVNIHLVLAGIFVSLRVAGWRLLSVLTGVTLIFLGAAGIARPEQAGTWGVGGGGLAMLGGLGYLTLTVSDRYRGSHPQPAIAL